MNHEVRKVSITQGIATMEDGTAVNLNAVQAALNTAFSDTGDDDYRKAADEIAKLTGQEQTARGFVSMNSPDPESLIPNWSQAHCEAAQKEGWDIFDTYGSDSGPWQLQRLDNVDDGADSTQLTTDNQAWSLVLEGSLPHHQAARDFIRVHNPMEYDWALRQLHPLRGMNATHKLNEPAGYSVGGFVVGHSAKMNGFSQEATIIDLLDDGPRLKVLLEFDEPLPVNGVEVVQNERVYERLTRFFELPFTAISSTWRKPGSELVESFNAFVCVTGDASDSDDEGIQGSYQLQVRLKRPIQLGFLSPEDRTALAAGVLNEFHNRQGIEVLDDFDITAHLPDGTLLVEGDEHCNDDLVKGVSFEGKIQETELPFEHKSEAQIT